MEGWNAVQADIRWGGTTDTVSFFSMTRHLQPSNNISSGLKLSNPAHVLLPKAVMRASVHDDLHQVAWIAVSVAYVVQ
ncbi:hypothetical protein H0H92_009026, partial [Tricholoma furcatifolium]